MTELLALVDVHPTIRGRPGRPVTKPAAVIGDRGYDSRRHRQALRRRRIDPVIAERRTANGSGLGTLRWVFQLPFFGDVPNSKQNSVSELHLPWWTLRVLWLISSRAAWYVSHRRKSRGGFSVTTATHNPPMQQTATATSVTVD